MKPILHQSIQILLAAVLSWSGSLPDSCRSQKPSCDPQPELSVTHNPKPVTAPRPCLAARCVRVDLIIINRHRKVREWTEPNARGYLVTRREFSESWWIVLVDRLPCNQRKPFASIEKVINRGWCAFDPSKLSTGWAYQFGDVTVFSGLLIIIDSPYDYDLKHRAIYKPIRKIP